MTKRKIEEVENKFSQLKEDEEFTKKIQSELNAQDKDKEDDVVVLHTTRTTTTIEKRTERVVRKQTKKEEDSDNEEWKPVATKTIRF